LAVAAERADALGREIAPYERLIATSLTLGKVERPNSSRAPGSTAWPVSGLRRETDWSSTARAAAPFRGHRRREDAALQAGSFRLPLAAHAALDERRPPPQGAASRRGFVPAAVARAAGLRCTMLTTSHEPAALASADAVWTSFSGHDPAELFP
jgi:hypothetical protein